MTEGRRHWLSADTWRGAALSAGRPTGRRPNPWSCDPGAPRTCAFAVPRKPAKGGDFTVWPSVSRRRPGRPPRPASVLGLPRFPSRPPHRPSLGTRPWVTPGVLGALGAQTRRGVAAPHSALAQSLSLSPWRALASCQVASALPALQAPRVVCGVLAPLLFS